MYDYLIRHKIIQRNRDQIIANIRRAREELFGQWITNEDAIIHWAKSLCVDEFFNKLRTEGKHIKDYLPA
jgi:hypothetical protein